MSNHSQKAPYPPEVRACLEAAGHRLAVDHPSDLAARDGPLWLFIHGIAASAGFWAPLMPAGFRQSCAWVSASLPIHGTSTGPEGFSRSDVTAELFVSSYAAVIAKFAARRPVIVVGHSTGGFAGLCLAHAQPDRIACLVSAGGFAHGHWTGLEGDMQLWAREEKLGLLGPGLLRVISKATTGSRGLQRLAAAQFAGDKEMFLNDGPTAESLEAVRSDARYQNPKHLIEFFAGIRDVDIRDLLAAIQTPVLVVDGMEDSVIPVDHTRQLAASLPSGELKLFPGAGHMIMNERREAFWTAVQEWVSVRVRLSENA